MTNRLDLTRVRALPPAPDGLLMRDSTSLFDHQADAADELTREFWGDKATWVSDDRGRRTSGRTMQVRPNDDQRDEYRLDHTPTSMRAVRDGIAAFDFGFRWKSSGSRTAFALAIVSCAMMTAVKPTTLPLLLPFGGK